jgi:hypothetical protein
VQQSDPPYVPGASSGSSGEPGPGPAQPMPPYMPYRQEVSFLARTTLTAQWPINDSKPDDIAVNVEKLREKLIAAKLDVNDAGQPLAVSTRPVSQPAFNPPMAQVAVPGSYRTPGGFEPGDGGLQLICTGTLSKSERKSALAAATAKAKQQAAELAEAADCHLGPLASVSGGFQEGCIGVAVPSAYGPSMQPGNDDGVVSFSPELPEVAVRVTLQFHIAP